MALKFIQVETGLSTITIAIDNIAGVERAGIDQVKITLKQPNSGKEAIIATGTYEGVMKLLGRPA